MKLNFAQRKSMRILLRRQDTGLYWQPTGEWREDRRTAQVFSNAVVAYMWAQGQRLPGSEVLLAFEDPRHDLVAMRT